MSKLPEWVTKSEVDNVLDHEDLKKALTIAWEALEHDLSWKSIKGAREGAKEAMRRIEEIGK